MKRIATQEGFVPFRALRIDAVDRWRSGSVLPEMGAAPRA